MKPTRRSTLFLLELLMAILLFSLAATVCVQIFVKSHTLEKESTELTKAVFLSTSVAEIFRSNDNYEELLFDEFPHAVFEDRTYLIYCDENFSPSASSGTYCLKFVTDIDDAFTTGHIYVYKMSDDSTLIYDLEIKKFNSKEDEQV